ncbi:type I restriction-modification system specificity subunit S [Firmicutes bacterium CAG:145]|nr:type I restriction-modification system specificity subunit S [Firmicutes bacterium CAG:145]
MKFVRNWGRLGMKCNWTTKKLSEIANINPKESIGKGVVAKKVPMDKLQPFCRDIPEFVLEEYKGGTKFRNGDTIMARITPCLENGKIAKVSVLSDDEVGFGSTEYIVFRAIDGVSDAEFLYYLICSPLVRNPAIKSMVGSSGRQRVQTDVVASLNIEIPPFEEQRKIGGLLKALDDKIELNNQINNNLFEQAQSLFKSWFIDFDPFSNTMPEDWAIGTIGDIIEVYDSKRVPLSGSQRDKMDKIYPYYGATSLMDYVDDYLFDGIYLLLGEDGTVVDRYGFPILQYVEGKFWVNNHAHILRGKNGFSVETLYLLFSLTNIKSIVTGAVQQKISQSNLKKIEIIIPAKEILSNFDEIVQPIFAQIRNLRREIEKLKQLRDELLPKLMSGEIDVSDIEI